MKSKIVLATFVFPLALMAVLLSSLNASSLISQAAASRGEALNSGLASANVIVQFGGKT
jgi:hypothetical protein